MSTLKIKFRTGDKKYVFRPTLWYIAFFGDFTAGYSRGPLRYEQDISKVRKIYPDGNKFQGTSCYYKSLEIQGNEMLMTHYCDVIIITHSNDSILFWIDEELFPFYGFIIFHLGNNRSKKGNSRLFSVTRVNLWNHRFQQVWRFWGAETWERVTVA